MTAYDGAVMIGSAALDAGGNVTLTTAVLSVGSHPLTLVYTGDAIYDVSTSNLVTQVVNKADSTVSITSSQNPQGVGLTVTFTGGVSAVAPGAGTPTGNAILKDNGVTLATTALSSGSVTFDVSSLRSVRIPSPSTTR